MPIHKIKLLGRMTVADKTVKFTFEKPDGFNFVAGQYGGFTLVEPTHKDDKGITRRFSILSTPDDEQLSIVTRIQDSAYKKNLMEMQPGHEIKFAGPTGNFVLHEDRGIPAVFIAGGIGIAPFYSIIKDVLANKPEQEIILLYGNNTIDSSAFIEELSELQNEKFKMVSVLAKPPETWNGEVGHITDEIIYKSVADIDNAIFYVCGSLAMVTALQQTLLELDISEDRIKVEDFPGY